jgi:hypothetical protein
LTSAKKSTFLAKYLAIVNHVLITFWKYVEMQPCMQIDLQLVIKIRSSKLVECGCHNWFFCLVETMILLPPKSCGHYLANLLNDSCEFLLTWGRQEIIILLKGLKCNSKCLPLKMTIFVIKYYQKFFKFDILFCDYYYIN